MATRTATGRFAGTAPQFRMCLPLRDQEELVQARARLGYWLQGLGVERRALEEMLIAAGEACMNAWEHSGARPGADGCAAMIEGTVQGVQVQVTVADRGCWKQPRHQLPGRRGRGRMMMAGLVDQMQIGTGPDGTTVELVKTIECFR